MAVPPAREGAIETLLHGAGLEAFLLDLGRGLPASGSWLRETRDERAIGVVYHPEDERGNYLPSRLADRYDAYVFVDRTLAMEPIERGPEPPGLETYPSGV